MWKTWLLKWKDMNMHTCHVHINEIICTVHAVFTCTSIHILMHTSILPTGNAHTHTHTHAIIYILYMHTCTVQKLLHILVHLAICRHNIWSITNMIMNMHTCMCVKSFDSLSLNPISCITSKTRGISFLSNNVCYSSIDLVCSQFRKLISLIDQWCLILKECVPLIFK